MQDEIWLKSGSSSGDAAATRSPCLAALVVDALEFLQAERLDARLDPAPFDVSQIVDEAIERVRAEADRSGLVVDRLMRPYSGTTLVNDRQRAVTLLVNLLRSAMRSAARAGPWVEISHLHESPRLFKFNVSSKFDPRSGVSPEADLQRRRLQSKRYSAGSSINLAISRNLAELLGGSVGVDGHDGSGTTYWCTIRTAARAKRPQAPSGRLPEPPAAPLRVMIVSDLAEEITERPFGCALAQARDAADAVRKAREVRMDLVLVNGAARDFREDQLADALALEGGASCKSPLVVYRRDADLRRQGAAAAGGASAPSDGGGVAWRFLAWPRPKRLA